MISVAEICCGVLVSKRLALPIHAVESLIVMIVYIPNAFNAPFADPDLSKRRMSIPARHLSVPRPKDAISSLHFASPYFQMGDSDQD